ncbi:MAG TPA: hypothetical protein VFF73_09975 [Planctomycetota bacterium]|nr:hypothetical protein [Planctomycetota bacterium]
MKRAKGKAPKYRFDVSDPRFARVQELFATGHPDEGRAILRILRDEYTARRLERNWVPRPIMAPSRVGVLI